MTTEKLQEVLKPHKMWLNDEAGGKRTDLSGANLSMADLSMADLYGTDLYGANLSMADLSMADLYGTDLSGADLRGANLSMADLSMADLSGTDLRGANLSGADLYGTDLYGANLSMADLSMADLSGANLRGADLRGANLENIITDENTSFFQIACPDAGEFMAWKKANIIHAQGEQSVIIKLLIPATARRSSATSYKCRADRAITLEIQTLDGQKIDAQKAISIHDKSFEYVIGQECNVPDFDPDRWDECAAGIHFFINRANAVTY